MSSKLRIPGKRRKKERAPAEFEPFELKCVCGSKVEGNRRERSKRAACEDCGRLYWILPANPYPAPERRKKRKSRTVGANMGPQVEKVVAQAERIAGRVGKSVAFGFQWVGRTIADRAITTRDLIVRTARREVTPLRLLALAIVCIACATSMYGWHVQSIRNAEKTLRDARELAFRHLEQREYVLAHEQFQLAAQAAKKLERTSPEDLKTIQYAKEFDVVFDRCTLNPIELIEKARDEQDDQEQWRRTFETLYQGRWLVNDCLVLRGEGEHATAVYSTLPVVWLGEEPVVLDVQLDCFDALDFGSRSERRCVFAGQLQSVRKFDHQSESGWVIELKPDTAFLWAHADAYAALDPEWTEWNPLEEFKQVVADQANQLGVPVDNGQK